MRVEIRHLDDPRLDPYRNLRRTARARSAGQFVVEGQRVVRRLIDSGLAVASIVISEHRRDVLDGDLPDHVPCYVVPQAIVSQLVGYNFHQGAIACGVRPAQPSLADLAQDECARRWLVACPNTTDPDNLGGLIRLGAGFGVAGLLLGEKCADAYSRRVLRVSMGTAFQLPILDCRDLLAALDTLRTRHGFRLLAAVPDKDATPLPHIVAPERGVLLLGNEADGLAPEWIAASDDRVTIPMAARADSLNVTVAAGILLHSLCHSASPSPPRPAGQAPA